MKIKEKTESTKNFEFNQNKIETKKLLINE